MKKMKKYKSILILLLVLIFTLLSCQIKDLTYYQSEALQYLKEGDLQKAKTSYESALKLHETHSLILYNLANVYFNLKNYKDAKKYYIKSIIENTNFTEAYYNLGLTYMELNEPSKGYLSFLEAQKKGTNFIKAYLSHSYYLLRNNKNADALKLLKKIVKSHTNDFSLYYNIGFIEYDLNKFGSAVTNFSKAMKINKTHLNTRIYLARSYLKTGNHKEALKIINNIKIYKSNIHVGLLTAEYFINKKKWDKAYEILKKITDIHPDNYQLNMLLGEYYFVKKSYDEAIISYKRASNIKYQRKEPFIRIAELYMLKRKYSKARRILDRLAKSYKDDLSIIRPLMDVYYRETYFDKALKFGKLLMKLDKKNHHAQIITGLCYIRAEDESFRDLKKGIALLWPRRKDKPKNKVMLRYLLKALKEIKDEKKINQLKLLLSKKNKSVYKRRALTGRVK